MLAGIIPGIIMKAVILNSYEKRAVDVRTAEIQNQCTILCNQLSNSSYLDGITSEVIKSELVQLSNIYNGRVMVIANDFRIAEDTYDMDKGKTIVSEDVIRCFQGKGTSNYDAKNKYIEVTSPILDGNTEAVTGVMLVSVSTDTIVDSLAVLDGKASIVGITIGVVILVLASLAGFVMVKPFQRITRSISAVTEGYDDNYLHENAYTETQLISDAFNKMLGRMRVLDDSRNEFVSNVSHELKTPLTSMKVLADSLVGQQGVPEELYQEFMSDITAEIDRENKIITDLLSLVKMDKKAADVNITHMDINQLLEDILKRLRPIADRRNIDLILDCFRPVDADVDEVKFTLAISNLVENGIKYNVDDGWVRVSLDADHKYFYITVADSGMGIPEDSIERIFERFYRVDKSHSKEIGGTGLGLAITKSSIAMHHGTIKVFSKEGEGTTFSVRIPLSYIPS